MNQKEILRQAITRLEKELTEQLRWRFQHLRDLIERMQNFLVLSTQLGDELKKMNLRTDGVDEHEVLRKVVTRLGNELVGDLKGQMVASEELIRLMENILVLSVLLWGEDKEANS